MPPVLPGMCNEPIQKSELQLPGRGWIEVICGSMFSGKTEELIRRLNRAKIARLKVGVFKPAYDKRYHDQDIVSHNENSMGAVAVHSAREILSLSSGFDVIGLDESQFFDAAILEVATELADSGKRVIVSGLDTDYLGESFGCMPHLMAAAEYVTKLHAICVVCGEVACRTFRTSFSDSQALLGHTDHYEARCRRCFNRGEEEKAGRNQENR